MAAKKGTARQPKGKRALHGEQLEQALREELLRRFASTWGKPFDDFFQSLLHRGAPSRQDPSLLEAEKEAGKILGQLKFRLREAITFVDAAQTVTVTDEGREWERRTGRKLGTRQPGRFGVRGKHLETLFNAGALQQMHDFLDSVDEAQAQVRGFGEVAIRSEWIRRLSPPHFYIPNVETGERELPPVDALTVLSLLAGFRQVTADDDSIDSIFATERKALEKALKTLRGPVRLGN